MMNQLVSTHAHGRSNTVPHSRIGTLLQEAGKLTAPDIERVLCWQFSNGGRFGEAAQQLGLVTTADIDLAIAHQFRHVTLRLEERRFPLELVALHEPFSERTETLRAVRIQLRRRWFAPGRRALVVASIDSGAGASFVAANLAVMFSQAGERTLLVDANIRRPRLHKIFNLENCKGISEVLAGQVSLEGVVWLAGAALPELSILPGGAPAANPHAMVFRKTFDEIHDSLSHRFDTVLYDVSSFSDGADALAVAARAGGVLLVLRKDTTRVVDMRAAAERLRQCGIEIVGSVMLDF